MSGNSPVEEAPQDASFPAVGQYEAVPGPGDPGYVEPEPVEVIGVIDAADLLSADEDDLQDDLGEDQDGDLVDTDTDDSDDMVEL